jgi:hypothetical protein
VAGKKQTKGPPSPRELTHLLKHRGRFAAVALVWLIFGIAFFVFVTVMVAYSWIKHEPLALSKDIWALLAIWLGLEGAGTPVLWRVVKFYFPN